MINIRIIITGTAVFVSDFPSRDESTHVSTHVYTEGGKREPSKGKDKKTSLVKNRQGRKNMHVMYRECTAKQGLH
jgi:hypothetical protein